MELLLGLGLGLRRGKFLGARFLALGLGVVNQLAVVVHLPENQTLSRGVLARCAAVAGGKNIGHPLGIALAATHQNQGSHNGAYHRMQKGVADDGDDHQVLAPHLGFLDVDAHHVAVGGLPLGRGGHAEAAEIMLADQVACGLAHRFKVELLAQMPAEIAHEQRRWLVGANEIAVLARTGAEASVEIEVLAHDLANADVVVRKRVERFQNLVIAALVPFLGRKAEAHPLAAGMDARIGAPGAYRLDGMAEHLGQSFFQAPLNRKLTRLFGKTAERLAAIRDAHGYNGLQVVGHLALGGSGRQGAPNAQRVVRAQDARKVASGINATGTRRVCGRRFRRWLDDRGERRFIHGSKKPSIRSSRTSRRYGFSTGRCENRPCKEAWPF